MKYLVAFAAGFIVAYSLLFFGFRNSSKQAAVIKQVAHTVGISSPEVVGFLPYWLLGTAQSDYSPYITTLAYFGLTLSPDGSIQQYSLPGEAEPGWYALTSGKANPFLQAAKEKNLTLSLVVFSGSAEDITTLISSPSAHAANVLAGVTPIMREYGFTDLNIDIEKVSPSGDEERNNYVAFISHVKAGLERELLGTLTIDASPSDLIHKRLINLPAVSAYVDRIVLMTYDYHYLGSQVSGPVAPAGGAGIISEFDVETGVQKAVEHIPRDKILLGIPTYGYEWESLQESTRSATIPTTGLVISTRRLENFMQTCATCSAQADTIGKEAYVVYLDQMTGTYHHLFYPDEFSTEEKVRLSELYDLGGIAVWALGYEGKSILQPLSKYKTTLR